MFRFRGPDDCRLVLGLGARVKWKKVICPEGAEKYYVSFFDDLSDPSELVLTHWVSKFGWFLVICKTVAGSKRCAR